MLCRERQANARNLRQREKKLKDLSFQMEDERKQAQQYKDQVTLTITKPGRRLATVLGALSRRFSAPCRRRRATRG